VYLPESDVYQFGLLLWEFAEQRQPFQDEPIGALRIAVGQQGRRPPLNPDIPAAMRALIADCWSARPQDRPTFLQIMRRFETETVYFSQRMVTVSTVIGQLSSYFDGVRANTWAPEKIANAQVREVVMLFQDAAKEQQQLATLNRLVADPQQRATVSELVDLRLIEKLVPLLAKLTRLDDLAKVLIALFGDAAHGRQRVSAFAEAKGVAALVSIAQDAKKQKAAYRVIEAIQELISGPAATELLSVILESGRYDIASALVRPGDALSIVGSHVGRIVAALKKGEKIEYCGKLLESYIDGETIIDFLKLVSVDDAITSGSVPSSRHFCYSQHSLLQSKASTSSAS
jgi:hypothetical protein